MQTPKRHAWVLAGLCLTSALVGCQVIPQPSVPAPKVAPGASSATNGQQGNVQAGGSATTTTNTPSTTYTVKPKPLQSNLQLNGRVAPSRTADLTLHGSGTVTQIDVSPGQDVSQGAPLVEFALDNASLQAARTQASMAELTYESERDKLATANAGASPDTVQQQRAVIERDKAESEKVQQEQATAQTTADATQASRVAAKDQADRKVALAQVQLKSAQDALTTAQSSAKHAQDDAQRAQDAAQAAQAAALDDANTAVANAKQGVTTAQRQVDEATIKLTHAKLQWSTTSAEQAVESQQLKLDQDNDALKDATATQKASATATAAQQAAADAAVLSVKRAITADTLEMQHLKTHLDTARVVDDQDVKLAQMDLDGAKDGLTQAQTTLQQAQDKVQKLSKQSAAASTPGTSGTSSQTKGQLDPDSAQAAVIQAQHAVEAQTLNLQDTQAAAQAAADAVANPQAAVAQAGQALSAAQAQLQADQAKLTQLTSGNSNADVKTEQARVDLLRQQAEEAAAAAQPVVQLKAPFDGTVTEVGVNTGQTITPLPGNVDASVTGTAATAGQTSDGRPVAVRLVASGGSAVVADVQESDVGQLDVGQSVDVTFPGVQGQQVTGTVGDIASSPAPRTGSETSVAYPVRIDLPNLPPGVRIGMSANINVSGLNAGAGGSTLTVPRTALRSVNGQTVVTTIDPNGQSHDTPVQLGRTLGSDIEVLNGLKDGDTVAVYEPPTMAGQTQTQP
ncbi:MAG: HlyD family efflux transporter periplasmic adaptor subunit [Chloroflexi bacterium]|nr:HlyD family efflux transporter periplasmic adaptor subunit [Chloroflexota bacterium]